MDPITIMILGQVASMAAQAIGRAMAEGDYAKARKLREQAIAEYGPDIVPELEKAEAQEVGATEFGKLREDDSLRAQQLKVMAELGNVYDTGGMTEADKTAMALAANQVSGRAGQDYANLNAMNARRGTRNSGLEAAMYAQAGQTSANAIGQMAGESQIAARERALRALEAQGGLAGSVRGQDYRALSDRAAAQDAINRFNAGARERAGNENASRQQWTANFDLGRRDRRTGAMGNLAADYMGSAQRTQDTAAGIGDSASKAGSTAAGGQGDAEYLEWLKKNGGK